MPRPCLQYPYRYACGNLQSCKRVPQTVRRKMFKSVLFDKVIKPKVYCIGIDWLAGCFIYAYKKAVGFSPGYSKLFTKAVIILFVFLQNIKDDLRDLYCSFAACIFSRNGNNTFFILLPFLRFRVFRALYLDYLDYLDSGRRCAAH